VLQRESYTAQAHQQWRLINYPPLAGLLDAIETALPAPRFGHESCPPPRHPLTARSRPPIIAVSRPWILVHWPD
jgi:hypothetical protein